MIDFLRDWIGFIIGFVSFAYAVYVQIQASKLKKYQVGKLKNILKDCLNIMSQSYILSWNNDAGKSYIDNADDMKKIAAVHAISASLVRSIFHELSEIDLPYDESKLNSYVSCGLITSKWVWQQAIIFVESANEIKEPPNLPEDTRDYYKQQEVTSDSKDK